MLLFRDKRRQLGWTTVIDGDWWRWEERGEQDSSDMTRERHKVRRGCKRIITYFFIKKYMFCLFLNVHHWICFCHMSFIQYPKWTKWSIHELVVVGQWWWVWMVNQLFIDLDRWWLMSSEKKKNDKKKKIVEHGSTLSLSMNPNFYFYFSLLQEQIKRERYIINKIN